MANKFNWENVDLPDGWEEPEKKEPEPYVPTPRGPQDPATVSWGNTSARKVEKLDVILEDGPAEPRPKFRFGHLSQDDWTEYFNGENEEGRARYLPSFSDLITVFGKWYAAMNNGGEENKKAIKERDAFVRYILQSGLKTSTRVIANPNSLEDGASTIFDNFGSDIQQQAGYCDLPYLDCVPVVDAVSTSSQANEWFRALTGYTITARLALEYLRIGLSRNVEDIYIYTAKQDMRTKDLEMQVALVDLHRIDHAAPEGKICILIATKDHMQSPAYGVTYKFNTGETFVGI
jgi:hypothetical protein